MNAINSIFASLLLVLIGCGPPTPPAITLPSDLPDPTPSQSPPTKDDSRIITFNQIGSPAARFSAAAEVVDGKVVLVAGLNGEKGLSDGAIWKENEWKTIPSLVSDRFLMQGSSGTVDGKSVLFFWGGARYVSITKKQGVRLGDGVMYFSEDDRWQSVPSEIDSPSIRDRHCQSRLGDGFFVVWGGENENTPLADGGVYDVKAKRWIPIAKDALLGPKEREGASCWYDSAKDKLYLFGGFSNGALSDLWELSYTRFLGYPSAFKWRRLEYQGEPISARRDPSVGFGGGKLIVFGGTSSIELNDGIVIDLNDLTSVEIPISSEVKRSLLEDQKIPYIDKNGGEFYVVGDDDLNGHVPKLWSFSLSNLRWSRIDLLGKDDHLGVMGRAENGVLYLWSGRNESGESNSRGMRIKIP